MGQADGVKEKEDFEPGFLTCGTRRSCEISNSLRFVSSHDRKRRSIKTAAIRGEYRFLNILLVLLAPPSYAFIVGSKLAAKIGGKSQLKNSDSTGI